MKTTDITVPKYAQLLSLQDQLNGLQRQNNALRTKMAQQENETVVKLQEMSKRISELQAALMPTSSGADFSKVTDESASEWINAA
jgi:TolA-binding protein